MDILNIRKENIDEEHICCAIGNDKTNKSRALQKKEWMKSQFDKGLVFKRLNDRGKVFIEYMPIESSWKPLTGKNYMVINCLWVSGRFKKHGYSNKLLNECIDDAKKHGMDGVCVVSSSKVKPFLTDKRFFINKGFKVVDRAEPYFELLCLKINENCTDPSFTDNAKVNKTSLDKGVTFIYSNQCPFMEDLASIYMNILDAKNIKAESVKITSPEEARELGGPFGSFGMYYKGEFITHELMTEKKFDELVESLII